MMKSNFKRFIVVVVLFLGTNKTLGQGFVPLFNEYLSENLYVIHPAMAGTNLKSMRINTGSRQQWFDLPEAPGTNLLTLEYRASKNSILGAQFISDHNGYHSKNSSYLTYAYRIYLSDEIWNTRRSFPTKNDNIKELSFGLSVGSVQYRFDQSSFDSRITDPLLNNNTSGIGFITIDAGAAYVSTHLSAQISIKNITLSPTKYSQSQEDPNFDTTKYKHYLLSLQYEIYSNNGWNFEPSFLIQHLERTQDSSLDLNFKIYKLIPNGRLWLGGSYRTNFTAVKTPSEASITKQNYRHFTPVFGLNYKQFLVSYHYTTSLGKIKMGTAGLHYLSLGISIF